MTLPWAISADFAVATGQKIIDTAPTLWTPHMVPLHQSMIPLFDRKGFSRPKLCRQKESEKESEIVFVIDEPQKEFRLDLPLTEEYIDIVEEYKGDYPPTTVYVDTVVDGSSFQVEVPINEDETFDTLLQMTHPNEIISYYYNQNND